MRADSTHSPADRDDRGGRDAGGRSPSRGVLVRVLTVAVVCSLSVAGLLVWTLARLPAGSGPETAVTAGPADTDDQRTLAPLPAQVLPPGTPAEELVLPALDGGTVDLASLRGRPVVVNFWAPDCVPCEAEFPLLAAAYARHAGAGLEIVGVAVRGSPADVGAFVRDHGAGWSVALDPDQRAAGRWGVAGIPQTFFVRADGTVASRQLGELTAAGFDRQLEAIL